MKKLILLLLLFSCTVQEKDFLEPEDYVILNSDFLLGTWKVEERTLDNLIPVDNITSIVFKENNVCLINNVKSYWKVQKDLITINPVKYTGPRLYLDKRMYDIVSSNRLISSKNNSTLVLK